MNAIVDAVIHPFLIQYQWTAVKYHRCWYARITRKVSAGIHPVSMHRLIANTPRDMICHHRNRNSLDNRRANLLNMTREEHKFLHLNNTLLIRYEEPTSPPLEQPGGAPA